MHLAHNKAAIKVVYDKAIYLPQRKKMVQWYADYLDALRDGMTEAQRNQFKAKVNAE